MVVGSLEWYDISFDTRVIVGINLFEPNTRYHIPTYNRSTKDATNIEIILILCTAKTAVILAVLMFSSCVFLFRKLEGHFIMFCIYVLATLNKSYSEKWNSE